MYKELNVKEKWCKEHEVMIVQIVTVVKLIY